MTAHSAVARSSPVDVARLRADLTAAMRARDASKVRVLRTVLAAIDNAEAVPADASGPATSGESPIAGAASGVGATEAARRELTAGDIAALVRAERDERVAAAAELAAVGAVEQAAELRAEAALLDPYLTDEGSLADTTRTLLAAGRDADVFEHSDGWVLRRYRNGRPADREGDVLRRLHDLGYPVPAVASVEGPDLVMARVEGPTLADAMLSGQVTIGDAAALLADLHRRLHDLDWPGDEPLLHLDLHPQNVMIAATGPVVIDWSNARPGPAGLDVAVTALILGQLAVNPAMAGAGPELDELIRAVAIEFLTTFTAAVATPFADELPTAVAMRDADRNTSPEERAMLGAAAAVAARIAAGGSE